MRDLAFIDVETTGLEPDHHEVIEVAAVRVNARSLEIKMEMDTKVHPEHPERAEPEALQQNGYTAEGWVDARLLPGVLAQLTPLLSGCCLAGHNVGFDWAFLRASYRRADALQPDVDYHFVDTASLAWPLVVAGLVERPKLDALCDYFGISNEGAHSAPADVRRTIEVYGRLMPTLDPTLLARWLAMQGDERDIIAAIVERIHDGRDGYGPWHVEDGRNSPREALHEVMDALNYCAAELVRMRKPQ